MRPFFFRTRGFDSVLHTTSFLLALGTATLACPALVAQEAESAEEVSFNFQSGPTTGQLGDRAEIAVPEGFTFLDGSETTDILRVMGNIPDGSELGSIYPASDEEDWFMIFDFAEVGFVDDSDRDELDPEALLESMKEGNVLSNEQRRELGLSEMFLQGWEREPSYNRATQNLEWCLRFLSEGEPVVNCNTRLLGRRGYTSVTLVADPDELPVVFPQMNVLLDDFNYTDGERYAQFNKGDKIAEYGLAGLVLGGAAAVALKTGFLQKFWKLLVLGFIAAASFIRRLFGGKSEAEGTEPEG